MAFEVRVSRSCRRDLEAIFDHLVDAHLDLGEDEPGAFALAEGRLARIQSQMARLGEAPHQGTLWPEVMDGLRWVTKDRAIFYFIADDQAETVDVLAVFFGGQDHREHVLRRVLGRG